MLDIMTLAEWKASTALWSQVHSWHANLQAIDDALSAYETVPKQKIEDRILKLSRIMGVTERYVAGQDVNSGVLYSYFQTQTHIDNKAVQALILLKQAEAKREYLAGIMGIERNYRLSSDEADKAARRGQNRHPWSVGARSSNQQRTFRSTSEAPMRAGGLTCTTGPKRLTRCTGTGTILAIARCLQPGWRGAGIISLLRRHFPFFAGWKL